MIQARATLDVADNSGAKMVQCIKVLGGSRRRYAGLGDIIVVSIKEAMPNAKVKKGDTAHAVVVRIKHQTSRADGSYVRFALAQSTRHRDAIWKLPYSTEIANRFARLAEGSLVKQRQIETADTLPFEIYRQQYLSPDRLHV